MHVAVKEKVAIHLLRQRNFAYLMTLFLMVVTLLLLVRLWSVSEKVIVIPSLSDHQKQYEFDGKKISENYLVDWSSSLLGGLFTANPQNVERKNKAFLEWALSNGSLVDDLAKSALKLKKDNISTAFYPESFKVSHDEEVIYVTGHFLSFFGRSLEPISSQKTFALGWTRVSGGLLAIKSLEEVKND